MLELAALVAILAVLGYQTRVLHKIATRPDPIPPEPPEERPTIPAEHARYWRVLQKNNNAWEPDYFVREGSEAWKRAYNTPGMALQSCSGKLEEGCQ